MPQMTQSLRNKQTMLQNGQVKMLGIGPGERNKPHALPADKKEGQKEEGKEGRMGRREKGKEEKKKNEAK